MRLRTILLATTFGFAVLPAFAQSGAPAVPSGVKAAQNAAPAAKPAAPVRRPVASFWTSAEPTFDEGTYDRINAAMLCLFSDRGARRLAEGRRR